MQVTWDAPTGLIVFTVHPSFTILAGIRAPAIAAIETTPETETTVPESRLIKRNLTASLHTLAILLLKQSKAEKSLR